jgi:hypothetical protein
MRDRPIEGFEFHQILLARFFQITFNHMLVKISKIVAAELRVRGQIRPRFLTKGLIVDLQPLCPTNQRKVIAEFLGNNKTRLERKLLGIGPGSIIPKSPLRSMTSIASASQLACPER